MMILSAKKPLEFRIRYGRIILSHIAFFCPTRKERYLFNTVNIYSLETVQTEGQCLMRKADAAAAPAGSVTNRKAFKKH